ncbi:MAG: sodium:proton antiporter [Desulfurococcaceae archaeon]
MKLYTSPYEAVYLTTVSAGLVLALLIFMYYLLKGKRVRETPVYLSGEPEVVVSSTTPSVGSLYWGFIRKFAKSIYSALIEKIHTGSLHDWYRFISSWLSILIITAIVLSLVVLFTR